jgi:hypothetical protein
MKNNTPPFTPSGQGYGHGRPTFSMDNKKLPDKIQPACVK